MSGTADDATSATHRSIAPRGLGSRAPTTALTGWGRKQSASLYDVFVLAVTMLDGRPVDEILQLAMDEVPHLLDCRPEGCYMLRDGRFELEATPSTRALGGRAPRDLTDPVEQLTALEGEDGAVPVREGGGGGAVGRGTARGVGRGLRVR
ncbi:hypothetical protein ACFXDI_43695, partial [Streptomyces mirabilis]|uniref:hypothetical protein n=1 Tax=Streptomyces mirabilis TaxID=68239 RepID=UPI003674B00C